MGLSRLAPGALRQLLYFGFGKTFAFGQTALHNIANCELAASKIMRPAERFVNYAAAPSRWRQRKQLLAATSCHCCWLSSLGNRKSFVAQFALKQSQKQFNCRFQSSQLANAWQMGQA